MLILQVIEYYLKLEQLLVVSFIVFKPTGSDQTLPHIIRKNFYFLFFSFEQPYSLDFGEPYTSIDKETSIRVE